MVAIILLGLKIIDIGIVLALDTKYWKTSYRKRSRRMSIRKRTYATIAECTGETDCAAMRFHSMKSVSAPET